MPDWSYRTVTQPLLFRISASRGRDFALGFMGRLARLPFGPSLIGFLGHMRPDPRLRRTVFGIDFPSPVGLGPSLDTEAIALPAFARFGFGFLEVGPVCVAPAKERQPIERLTERQAFWIADVPPGLAVADLVPRLAQAAQQGLPLLARLTHSPGAPLQQVIIDYRLMIEQLASVVQCFSLAVLDSAIADKWSVEAWTTALHQLVAVAPCPVLLCVAADVDTKADELLHAAVTAGISGWLADGSVAANDGGRHLGQPARAPTLACVRHLRERWSNVPIVASGGIHEPEDALALLAAGADLVQVDTGLVFTGPGLPKRINEAILYTQPEPSPSPETQRPTELAWFWTTLMGAGMLLGSVLALAIAATRVVLPYDEVFVGLTRNGFEAINPRLLAFMAHDRISLAGTMIAIGGMYVGLSWFGIRRGQHWALMTVFVSAFTGFASFFTFLGFGYLDTLHAFVTAVLLQFLLLAVHCRLGPTPRGPAPCLRSDTAWRLSLWGQLLLIVHACGLLGAGAVITTIGVTHVFVPEDLEFMQTTAETLRSANVNLVPLIAHDRATFGGMLLASGWVFLLPALWGFRRGQRWLWWTMLCAGMPAYIAAIGVHFAVGYINAMHLLPAFSGLGLFLLGLALVYPFLDSGPQPRAEMCN